MADDATGFITAGFLTFGSSHALSLPGGVPVVTLTHAPLLQLRGQSGNFTLFPIIPDLASLGTVFLFMSDRSVLRQVQNRHSGLCQRPIDDQRRCCAAFFR